MKTTDTEPTAEERELTDLAARYDAARGLIRTHGAHGVGHSSPRFVELLLRRSAPGDAVTAARVLGCILDEQMPAEGADAGRFPMLIPEEWRDLNGTLFLISSLVAAVEEHAALLPAPLVARAESALRLAVTAVESRWQDEVFDVHRDFVAYSNVFVLYVQSLMLLARHFGDPRLRRAGGGQWRRWFNHVSYYGVDEFLSPNYNHIIGRALLRMQSAAPDPACAAEIGLALEYLMTLACGVQHPALGVPIAGISRDYRRFLAPGGGGFPALADGMAERWAPARAWTEYRNRQYPYGAEGRAGLTPFRFTSWQMPDHGLGSMTGGHYFPQQLHLVAAAGRSPEDRAIAFLNAEPNLINGWVAQRDGRALCLFARTGMSYRHTQLRERIVTEPAPRSRPMTLGLSGDWSADAGADGALRLGAYGRTLRVTLFAWDGCRPRACIWTEGEIKVGGRPVRAFCAPAGAVYAGCVVEWLDGHTAGAPPSVVTGELAESALEVQESGGLRLTLARLPNGEFVERYSSDWRTLPLIRTPACTVWPGEMTWRSANPV